MPFILWLYCTCSAHSAVDCGDPGILTNGQRRLSSTTYNSVVTYTCDVDYTLQGSNSRSCQSNGQWSGSVPQCNGTVHDTENLTFSADDRAENPHISARTISGFRADNQRIPCGTISKFYSYNDVSNDPCGVFLDLLALLRTKFAFWFPPFSN